MRFGSIGLVLLLRTVSPALAQEVASLGDYYYRTHSYHFALSHYAQDLATMGPGNSRQRAALTLKIANGHFRLGAYTEAIRYYKLVAASDSDGLLVAASTLNLSSSYARLKDQKISRAAGSSERTKITKEYDALIRGNYEEGLKTYYACLAKPADKISLAELMIELPFPMKETLIKKLDYQTYLDQILFRWGETHPDRVVFFLNQSLISSRRCLQLFRDWKTGLTNVIVNKVEPTPDQLELEAKLDSELDRAWTSFKAAIDLSSKVFGEKSPITGETHYQFAMHCSALSSEFLSILSDFPLEQTPYSEYGRQVAVKYRESVKRMDLEALSRFNAALGSSLYNYTERKADGVPVIDSYSGSNIQEQCSSLELLRRATLSKVEFLIHMNNSLYPTTEDWMKDYSQAFSLGRWDSFSGSGEFNLAVADHALKLISFYDRYIDIFLGGLFDPRDQFQLSNLTRKDRLLGVEVAFNRFNHEAREKGIFSAEFDIFRRLTVKSTVTKTSLYDAFYFAEKTKGLLLATSLNTGNSAMSSIPLSELKKKNDLTDRIAAARQASTPGEELLRLSHELRQLEESFEQRYPAYAASKKEVPIASLSDIQKSMDPGSALLSYTITPSRSSEYSHFYLFIITPGELEIRTRSLRSEKMDHNVKGMRAGIVYQLPESFEENAFELQRKLIPKLDETVKNLIIVPDDYLHVIPFEALLTERVKKKDRGNRSLYKYLIDDYVISYAFSATLYARSRVKSEGGGRGLLALAPVFSDDFKPPETSLEPVNEFEALDSTRTRGILKDGGYVSPIPNTKLEVEKLAEESMKNGLPAKVFTFKMATEDRLKAEDLSGYQYVHFATHGFVNSNEPDRSGLLLETNAGDKEDGVLMAGEIATLPLNVYMVCLSACETGLGKIELGEGVVGLSRAFAMAGAKNLVVSYWKVSDESTALLMIEFYKLALEGKSLSSALQSAKLNLIRSGQYADPYYWSPFILIGQ